MRTRDENWGLRLLALAILVLCLVCFVLGEFVLGASYYFRIKTKSGSIHGNVPIEGKDQYDAEVKLRKRYPECTILGVKTKK